MQKIDLPRIDFCVEIFFFQINAASGTLNTNFSPLRTAMVSKCPSQMSGPCSGLGTLVGRGGGGGGGAPDLVPVVGKMFNGEVTSWKRKY